MRLLAAAAKRFGALTVAAVVIAAVAFGIVRTTQQPQSATAVIPSESGPPASSPAPAPAGSLVPAGQMIHATPGAPSAARPCSIKSFVDDTGQKHFYRDCAK